jgi:hypothetical protein
MLSCAASSAATSDCRSAHRCFVKFAIAKMMRHGAQQAVLVNFLHLLRQFRSRSHWHRTGCCQAEPSLITVNRQSPIPDRSIVASSVPPSTITCGWAIDQGCIRFIAQGLLPSEGRQCAPHFSGRPNFAAAAMPLAVPAVSESRVNSVLSAFGTVFAVIPRTDYAIGAMPMASSLFGIHGAALSCARSGMGLITSNIANAAHPRLQGPRPRFRRGPEGQSVRHGP